MNDEQSQQSTDASDVAKHDRTAQFVHPFDREAILSSLHTPSNASPHPVTPGHVLASALSEKAYRQTMPHRDDEEVVGFSNSSNKPDERPPQTMVDPGDFKRLDMIEHDGPRKIENEQQSSTAKNDSSDAEDGETRQGAVGDSEIKADSSSKNKEVLKNKKKEVPPDSADLVTVEEAVKIFNEAGLPRHIRTIQKYCAKKEGRALVSYQIPTENGIRYMIDRSSIIRFINDATHQVPTGKLEDEPESPQIVNKEEVSAQINNSVTADLAVYDHPYVKRLESEVENEKERYASLQMRFETAMDVSNQRLIELQQAAAIAQSENLGKFMLESKRLDHDAEPVHTPSLQEEGSMI